MGLGRSKHKRGKGEKQNKEYTYSGPRPKERSMNRQSQDSEKPLDTAPAEGHSQRKAAAKQHCLSPKVKEKTEAKVRLGEKRAILPQIVISRASSKTVISYNSGSSRNEEQKTIREPVEWGPYARHRNPSTIDAYTSQTKQ
ncbi:spermatogenesis-associated protein 33 [Phyllostomus hastatus]|uniref:spermatogenesis-associated protein 33 n=1 Tax=Phyllostomus hastatus TaxID=9423 RepID=UPI001E680E2F|nr:spermatogenesis-associated protein 33 [Phyllostomus hastatus]